MDLPPSPKSSPPPQPSPWNLPWKVTVATPGPTPDSPSGSFTIGLATAEAYAAFPEFSANKLTKAQLRAAKKRTPPLLALSTPDLNLITLASIPEVSPLRTSPNRSPVRQTPQRFDHRASPTKMSPELPNRPYSVVFGSPRNFVHASRGIQNQKENNAAGHVGQSNAVSGSLVSVPALAPTQKMAEPTDEQHNALISSESRLEFSELQDENLSAGNQGQTVSTPLLNVSRNLEAADQLESTTMLTQGHKIHDTNSTTPPNPHSVDNSEMESIQPNGEDRTYISPVPPALKDTIPSQSKVEISNSAARCIASDVNNTNSTQNEISTSETQGKDTTISNVDEMKKSEESEMEANDIEKDVADIEVSSVLDEIDTLITPLIKTSSFNYEMNSAAQEKIKQRQAQAECFHFLPLTDDSTYNTLAKTVSNTSTSLVLEAPVFGKANRHYETSQSIFPDDPPRRYRALPFSSPEAAAYHHEYYKTYLKNIEQHEAYDSAVPNSFSGEGTQCRQDFQPEQGSRGKMAARRGSVSYVVDVSTLQKAVADDPDLILDRIKGMKDEIKDLRLEVAKEGGVRKWTITQYEALQSISFGKQMLLWEFIGRLQRQNKALLDNGAHGHTQARIDSNSSPSLSVSELASYVEGQGSELFDGDIERKGTARRNSLESDSKLDPNAQAFVPSERGSPVTSERAYSTHGPHPFNYASSSPMTTFGSHSTSTAVWQSANNISISSLSTFDSAGPSTPFHPSNGAFNPGARPNFPFATQPTRRGRIIIPSIDAMSPQTFNLILASIPPFWRSICPISLSSDNPCLNTRCVLRKLCRLFNQLAPPMACRTVPCGKLHMMKSCEQEVDGRVCQYTIPSRSGNFPRGSRQHAEKRIHKGGCVDEEWRIRCVVNGLKGMHARGAYMG